MHTFGPFVVDTSTYEIDKKSFWKGIAEKHPSLGESFGLYIFASQANNGELIPWYVGKTERPFSTRFNSHFKNKKVINDITHLISQARIRLFFIAVTTPKRGNAAKKTKSRVSWLDYLETAIIGACMSVNPRITNIQKTILQSKVKVPGFLGDDPMTRNDSAKALAALLVPVINKSELGK